MKLPCKTVLLKFLYGKIAAGTPIEAIANETETIPVPFEMVAHGQFYALTIEGESMTEAGILDGDTVIIKKSDTANNGEIAVALVDNSEATLKIIKKDGDKVSLRTLLMYIKSLYCFSVSIISSIKKVEQNYNLFYFSSFWLSRDLCL